MQHTMYYANITHDGLLKDQNIPRGKQKILVYAVSATNFSEAERQFRGLESQFQGQNFKILNSGQLSSLDGPVLVGIKYNPIKHKG